VRVGEEVQAVSWEVELSSTVPRIHVVAGVLEDAAGRVLIAQRPEGKSLAGAWEFPGGKLQRGEAAETGLARELKEELGIRVDPADTRPLIRYVHRYPALEVELETLRVRAWAGIPRGLEGQALDWKPPDELLELGLLPADAPIVTAIRLPDVCAVLPPDAWRDPAGMLDALETLAASGRAGLVVLRCPGLAAEKVLELAAGAACRVEGSGCRLMLHGDPAIMAPVLQAPPAALAPRIETCVAGLHVPGRYLAQLASRPVSERHWFGVSCHDAAQLEAARRIGADYAFLGPVKETASHPGQPGMGWEMFASLVRDLPLPVYAIGGLSPQFLEAAWANGAQGIAAIRGLWPAR
jgi:8-oxo-dGTP diphosphatase